ncbi:spore coat protein F-like protein YraG [Robertmurraya siralis]|uniref:Spore coat protein F-like protein YraG n=1 Tax=Robertmurraya siralis TaxID=77777 RepID=A0A919WLN7_9BACI|nr:spore coat protein [Robertmurraya siralis]PAE22441.1 spore coat protein [Bacillus sp. 7504-2]GIN64393.1 spore coat protein F-like protein YraG [Robertmurraya siralis]
MGSESKEVLAFHETMETHELLNFKTICLVKAKLMQGLCFDNDLKALMEKDVQQSMQAIQELKELYAGARTTLT